MNRAYFNIYGAENTKLSSSVVSHKVLYAVLKLTVIRCCTVCLLKVNSHQVLCAVLKVNSHKVYAVLKLTVIRLCTL